MSNSPDPSPSDSWPSAPPSAPGPASTTALAVSDAAPAALDAHGYDPGDYDWVPVLRKPRGDGWTPQKQRAFISALADRGNVTAAARSVAMTPSSAYALRRAPGGEAFAAAWNAAIHQAAHALVDLAFERAFNGSDEPIYDREGRVVGRKHRQSDALIMFLLRKHFPARYGDLHRDRPERTAAPDLPAVAETLSALGPVQPADPLALVAPGEADALLQVAEVMDGALPHFQRQDGSVERAREAAAAAAFVDPEFELMLEGAKLEAKAEEARLVEAALNRTSRSRRRG